MTEFSAPDKSHRIPSGEPPGAASQKTAFAAVTGRAVLLGVAGAVQGAFFQMRTEVYPVTVTPPWVSGPYLSWYAVMPGAIFWISLVAVFNGALKRFAPRYALTPAEFAVIFGISTVAAAIGAVEQAMLLLPTHVYPFRPANADSLGPFRQYIPVWMVPHDPKIIEPYYLGKESFWTAERITAWAMPLLTWTTYLTALGATMWAWNVILRRRWVDGDRLTFPNMQVPLTICREAGFGGLASGRIFWGGFIVAAIYDSFGVMQQLLPGFPAVSSSLDLSGVMQALPKPWDALSPMVMMWPTVYLGICFLIPLDILFSAGAFYILRRLLEVFGHSMGWDAIGSGAGSFPYIRSQASGAWIALFFLLVWAERHHMRRVLDAALDFRKEAGRGPYDATEAQEFGSYRAAGRILIIGTLFLIAFSIASGMAPLFAVIFYAYYWMMQVTMTRIFCQVGPPVFQPYYTNPQITLTALFGSAGLPPATTVQLNLTHWLTYDPSGHPMGHQMAALHIARQTPVDPRPFGRWILGAFVLGGVVCLLSYLHFAYRVGEDQFQGGAGWNHIEAVGIMNRIVGQVHQPRGPQGVEIAALFAGGAITALLAKLSSGVLGFPLHPVGFALAMSCAVEYSWPAYLMMALFKFLTLRYGGRTLYEKFVPFFLGLTLGGLLTPVVWGWAGWALSGD